MNETIGIRQKYYSDSNEGKKLPVGSCLSEAVGLQDDRILQYSFLRVPKRGGKKWQNRVNFKMSSIDNR